MEEPIKVGDLVVVVRGCGCHSGSIFTVGVITPVSGWYACGICNEEILRDPVLVSRALPFIPHGANHLPLAWLKKIPPLGDLKFEPREEDLLIPV